MTVLPEGNAMSTNMTREALTAMVREGEEAGMYAEHGAAGFCTGHGQADMSADLTERVEAAAIEVLEDDASEGMETFDLGVKIAAAVLAAVADAPGLAETIRVVLSRGGYQMPGDALPYETQAFWVADVVRVWLRGT